MKLFSKVLFICSLGLLNSGCSIIGLAIGSSKDAKTPAFSHISYPDNQDVTEQARAIAVALKPGKEVVLTTRDKRQIAGKYQGFVGPREDPAIKISDKDTSVSIPISAISEIQWKNSRNGAVTGFLIGAVVDGAIIGMIIAINKSMEDAWEGPLFGEQGL